MLSVHGTLDKGMSDSFTEDVINQNHTYFNLSFFYSYKHLAHKNLIFSPLAQNVGTPMNIIVH